MRQIYEFEARSLQGKSVELQQFEGKVLLVVNTASKCGLAFQFKGLESVYNKYKSKGLEILAFPSDNFKGQEFKNAEQIQQHCVLNLGLSYPLFDKIDVLGPDAHPLFRFLSSKQQNGYTSAPPTWNFHKYLFNRQGELVSTFKPWIPVNSWIVTSKIKKYL